MKKAKLILLVVLVLLLAILIFQNTKLITLRFLWLSVEMPIVILALIGFALGAAVMLICNRKSKPR